MSYLVQNYFSCLCTIFVQSREAKWTNQHKIDTPTFSQISEGKWGIESKTIFHVYVIFLFKAAKLIGPIITKWTHQLFDSFQKAKKVLIEKLFVKFMWFLFKAAKLNWPNSSKLTHLLFGKFLKANEVLRAKLFFMFMWYFYSKPRS